ncbi:MAG: DUF1501 domain-containing protein [Planctomycetes bacterium]|nr:DUF1501 domain-containing protein [Planctomycetota bacterium]
MIELTRRAFLGQSAGSLGALALSRLLGGDESVLPHFAPRAKRVVYLFQSGGPSHIDLFDYKPVMRELHGQELPESVRGGQRVTGMTAGQKSFPVLAPPYEFKQHGESGAWVSELMPWTARIADKLCFLKGVHTDAINHDPAITTINTGAMQPGKASLGSWLSYGLGSENRDLPAYLVLLSQGTGKDPGQPLFSRLWGSGFLPPSHQGVQLRPGANPVLYLQNPPGVDAATRRALLDDLAKLNGRHADATGDPEARTRIDQYEMAFRMQTSVPELTDLTSEPEEVLELYGPDARKPGTYAANCLLARRMLERGVRMVQLFHRGWDQHLNLDRELRAQSMDTDQPSAALVSDLERLGLLEDTLVVWGGEFGRTVYSQGKLGAPGSGRDHHGRCFTVWMAGGGIKPGITHGTTDDWSYNVVEGGVHVNDLNATILHQLGIDHERFTYPYLGLDQRLTGVEEARVVREILA